MRLVARIDNEIKANARGSLLNPGPQNISEGVNTNIQLDNLAILINPKFLHANTKIGGIELIINALNSIPRIG